MCHFNNVNVGRDGTRWDEMEDGGWRMNGPVNSRKSLFKLIRMESKNIFRKYTISQPLRFIRVNLYKRTEQVRKNHYTICKEAGCEGCADIKNQEDKVEVALISSKYSVTSLI